mgnify:CR=1 FL=1
MKRLFLLSSLMFVMTLSISCSKSEKPVTGNPLLDEWNTEMGIPPFDEIKAEHYVPAFETAIEMHNSEIEAIVASEEEPSFDNVILAMDNAGLKLAEINLIFGMLSSSDLDEKMQEMRPFDNQKYWNTILAGSRP